MSRTVDPGATPLFIDTGAFYARFVGTAQRHDRATAVFEAIGTGEVAYRPLYTSTYVLDELATLILSHRDHDAATAALERVRESPTTVIQPDRADFDRTCEAFARYDDHEISLTDHMSGVLAADRDIEHVFTFDPDHFRTLEFTAVPDDTGEGV
ncbi:PilT protein [Halorhabdus tiamatea SARL4B]|uniref:PilT protein n=1 Tax=Halorhabdus tiamatea SARL4B TaxID=1033806 RepID=U2F2D7_9EURY|nr:PIN domain-containing protein [Halorhabdus tiamatea]ERJ04560.1 PilT protein [Halorhabdus tiamatea SARL4B]